MGALNVIYGNIGGKRSNKNATKHINFIGICCFVGPLHHACPFMALADSIYNTNPSPLALYGKQAASFCSNLPIEVFSDPSPAWEISYLL